MPLDLIAVQYMIRKDFMVKRCSKVTRDQFGDCCNFEKELRLSSISYSVGIEVSFLVNDEILYTCLNRWVAFSIQVRETILNESHLLDLSNVAVLAINHRYFSRLPYQKKQSS